MNGKFLEVLAWIRYGLKAASIGLDATCDLVGGFNATKDSIAQQRGLDGIQRELPRGTRHNGEQ